jgi:hypothetical protein
VAICRTRADEGGPGRMQGRVIGLFRSGRNFYLGAVELIILPRTASEKRV